MKQPEKRTAEQTPRGMDDISVSQHHRHLPRAGHHLLVSLLMQLGEGCPGRDARPNIEVDSGYVQSPAVGPFTAHPQASNKANQVPHYDSHVPLLHLHQIDLSSLISHHHY